MSQPPHPPTTKPTTKPATRQATQPPAYRTPLLPLLSIAIGVSAFTLGVQALGALQLFEWAALDTWFRRRPPELAAQYELPVVIITIDDNDIAAVGQWPLTDQKLADLVTLINQHEPAAIGLDLYRDLPITPGTENLQHVLSTTPNLIGIEKVVTEGASVAIAPHPTLKATDQIGFNDLVLDSDGRMRRHLISLRREDATTQFALGTTLALKYLETQFEIVPEPIGTRMQLGQASFSPLRPHAGAYVNADVGGYQILANYLRLDDGIPTVSLSKVMSARVSPDKLKGKIVFIGTKADSNWGDRFYTPYSQTSDESWSGVELHANLTAQLIASALHGRSPLNTLPEPLESAWILLWAIIGVSCHRKLATHWRWWLLPPTLIGSLVFTTYGFFLGHYWIPLVAPLLGFGSAWLTAQAYGTWYQLRQENQRLELTVQTRTRALQAQNQALEKAQVAAESANQAKSNFLTNISHELRTPLTAILGFGELLAHSHHLPKKEREYVQTINQGGEHLLRLINTVLDLSKIETAPTKLNLETIHLPTFLNNLQQLFQAQAATKQLKLSLSLADTAPAWIEIDSGKLSQIIINLLGNAIKFTSGGEVTIHVQRSQAHREKGKETTSPESTPESRPETLEIWVEDTGPGLTPDEIESLFEPFVQTSAGKRLRTGSGLGLAIARQCAKLMGGTINVSSTYGHGSRFSILIPLQISPQPKQTLAETRPTATGPYPASDSLTLRATTPQSLSQPLFRPQEKHKNTRILIVDDDANSRRLLSQWLNDAQFDTQTTQTGQEALQAFTQWQPHIVLLDIHLPDIDGYEVARRIREQWALSMHAQPTQPSSNSPSNTIESNWLRENEPVIIAITAGVLQDNYATLLATGCDDVLWKPIKAETLFNKLFEYLL